MPTRSLLALLALVGCAPTGTIKLDDSGAAPADDTGAPTDDTGTPADDTGEEPEPEPEPDFTVWLGERVLYYDGCEDTMYEEGYAFESDWEYYDYTFEACPECDYVYYVEVSPSEVCGLGVTQETYRILDLDGDQATIYYFGNRGELVELATGDLEGLTLQYDYRLYDGAIDIEGRVDFPER